MNLGKTIDEVLGAVSKAQSERQWRCTRPAAYPPGSAGYRDLGARQGYYVTAVSSFAARQQLRSRLRDMGMDDAEPIDVQAWPEDMGRAGWVCMKCLAGNTNDARQCSVCNTSREVEFRDPRWVRLHLSRDLELWLRTQLLNNPCVEAHIILDQLDRQPLLDWDGLSRKT
jgi:hypothetical protein